MIEAALIGARFLHYAALVLLFGGWAYAGHGRADHRHDLLVVMSALLVLIGAMFVLAATVVGLGGSGAALADGELWTAILAETDFGRVWSARLAMALLSVIAALIWRRDHHAGARRIGLVLVGGLLVTIAWTGHAAIGEGMAGLLHRGSDALHILAAAVWLGALGPLLWLLARGGDAAGAAQSLTRFHAVGLASVLILIATGLVSSVFLVGDPVTLFTTRYGQLLTIKLLLFAAMIGFAAHNRLKGTPALVRCLAHGVDPAAATARLRRSIGAEIILGVIILAIVSVLGAIEPAASVT